MRLIEELEIKYFRSLKEVNIKSFRDLNIFSGKNDSGKSNVLKALQLFFNLENPDFEYDFNKERLSEVRRDSIKGKQFIKITMTINKPNGYKTLPDQFKISKTWDRNGSLLEQKDNLETLFKEGKVPASSLVTARKSLTGLMNKLHYLYIPAVRDDNFFTELLGLLRLTLFEAEERKRKADNTDELTEYSEKLNSAMKGITENLNSEFKQVAGIDTNLRLPSEYTELFKSFIIDTKHGVHDIPLSFRGDGIRMRYIPTILNHIAKKSKKLFIWGFDEPENSCEYSLCKEMANNFSREYIKNAQIFVSSHSFNFISLEGENISRYRVYMKENGTNSNISLINSANKGLLEKELGIININKELSKLYDELERKLNSIQIIEKKLEQFKKPFILLEGPSDNKHFKIIYKALFGRDISDYYHLNDPHTINGSNIGTGAENLNNFMYNHVWKVNTDVPIIAIFDYDREGYTQLKGLVRNGLYKQISIIPLFRHTYVNATHSNIFVMLLPPPTFRLDYIDEVEPNYCYLSTELLFKDKEIAPANRVFPSKNDNSVYSFKGDKMAFANRIEEKLNRGVDLDLSGFSQVFDYIKKISESDLNK